MAYDKPDFGDDELNDFSRFEDEEELGADRAETIEEEEAGEEELSVDEHPTYAPPSSFPATTSVRRGGKRKAARQAAKAKSKPKKRKAAKPKSKIRRGGKSKRRGAAKTKRRKKR